MSRRVHVLQVQESAADAEAILRALRQGSGDVEGFRVESEGEVAQALDRKGWDLILCDCSMPTFGAHTVLQMLQERCLDIPFIVIAEPAGEERALEMMRRGAHDYVLEGNFARLCAASDRELRQARTRAARRKTERALGESERRFRAIIEQASVGIVESDFEGTLVRVNPKFCAILDYQPDEILGRTFQSFTHPDDVASTTTLAQRTLEGEPNPAAIEKRYRRRDGTPIWVSVAPTLLRDEQGRPRSFFAVVEDIAARKAATQALSESEQRYRGLIETSPDVIWSVDPAGCVTFVSEAVRRVMGYEPAQMIGQPVSAFPGETDPSVIARVVARASRGETVVGLEGRRRRKDGKEIFVSYSAAPMRGEDGTIRGVIGRTSDISERRRSENAARLNAERLKLALGAIDMAVFNQDLDLRYTWMYQAQLGYGDEEVIGKTDAELLPAEAARVMTEVKRRALLSGSPASAKVRIELKEGGFHDHLLVVEPLREESGAITGLMGISLDITAKALSDERLRESSHRLRQTEQRFETLIENASDLILELDASAAMRFVSPSAFRLTGYDPATLLGQSILEFIHPDDTGAALEAVMKAQENPGQPVSTTLRIRHADGSLRTVDCVGQSVPGADSMVINARDVTDRVRLEEQFRQAQKMEAVGRLAGGVAHDFNNLLSVIMSYTELVRERVAHDREVVADVDEIRAAGERAVALTRQLLAFSRQQVMEPRTMDLNAVVAGMENMLKRLIGEDVKLKVVPAQEPVLARIDPGQIEQVLMNLAVNSRDAMPGGGDLTIETRRMVVEPVDAARHPGAVPGPHICLSVRDTGTGMEKGILDRIFEPFFTTKDQGQGTGLGLSTCYGIVKQSGGFITAASEPQRGSVFHVYLPESLASAAEEKEGTEAAPPASGGHEKILIVEDDQSLRAVTERVLRGAGYQVVSATDGEEALSMARQMTQLPDLLLTDVVMPTMSGPELAERLKQSLPSVRVLFMSGYTAGDRQRGGPVSPGRLLQKPFSPSALSRRVREALDGPR